MIDGDCDDELIPTSVGEQPFCTTIIARFLAARARDAGGGVRFSIAVVFARQEYESWLIGGVPNLVQQLKSGVNLPSGDLEAAPRGAKEWLIKHRNEGYKPTRHQKELSHQLDLEALPNRMRSFRRLDNAVRQLIEAVRTDQHIVSPL